MDIAGDAYTGLALIETANRIGLDVGQVLPDVEAAMLASTDCNDDQALVFLAGATAQASLPLSMLPCEADKLEAALRTVLQDFSTTLLRSPSLGLGQTETILALAHVLDWSSEDVPSETLAAFRTLVDTAAVTDVGASYANVTRFNTLLGEPAEAPAATRDYLRQEAQRGGPLTARQISAGDALSYRRAAVRIPGLFMEGPIGTWGARGQLDTVEAIHLHWSADSLDTDEAIARATQLAVAGDTSPSAMTDLVIATTQAARATCSSLPEASANLYESESIALRASLQQYGARCGHDRGDAEKRSLLMEIEQIVAATKGEAQAVTTSDLKHFHDAVLGACLLGDPADQIPSQGSVWSRFKVLITADVYVGREDEPESVSLQDTLNLMDTLGVAAAAETGSCAETSL